MKLITNIINIENYKIFNKIMRLKGREIIFLCVGNSHIWYDSFGPIIGSILIKNNINNFVYGNLIQFISRKNINAYINMIYKYHNSPYIIIIDNALTITNSCGIKIKQQPTICASLSDDPIEIGDMSITYKININNIHDKTCFKDMLHTANLLADIISEIKKMVK